MDFLKTRKYEEQQWRATRKGGHLLIVEFEKAFIKRLKEGHSSLLPCDGPY